MSQKITSSLANTGEGRTFGVSATMDAQGEHTWPITVLGPTLPHFIDAWRVLHDDIGYPASAVLDLASCAIIGPVLCENDISPQAC